MWRARIGCRRQQFRIAYGSLGHGSLHAWGEGSLSLFHHGSRPAAPGEQDAERAAASLDVNLYACLFRLGAKKCILVIGIRALCAGFNPPEGTGRIAL